MEWEKEYRKTHKNPPFSDFEEVEEHRKVGVAKKLDEMPT